MKETRKHSWLRVMRHCNGRTNCWGQAEMRSAAKGFNWKHYHSPSYCLSVSAARLGRGSNKKYWKKQKQTFYFKMFMEGTPFSVSGFSTLKWFFSRLFRIVLWGRKSMSTAVVATPLQGTLTHKHNADSGVRFITQGPRQNLLLTKDPYQFLWKPYIP